MLFRGIWQETRLSCDSVFWQQRVILFHPNWQQWKEFLRRPLSLFWIVLLSHAFRSSVCKWQVSTNACTHYTGDTSCTYCKSLSVLTRPPTTATKCSFAAGSHSAAIPPQDFLQDLSPSRQWWNTHAKDGNVCFFSILPDSDLCLRATLSHIKPPCVCK